MFSSVLPSMSAQNGRNAPPKKPYFMQAPKGFTVRVFKGPTLSSLPYATSAKFDLGYKSESDTDARQKQHWFSARSQQSQKPVVPPRPMTAQSSRPRVDSIAAARPPVFEVNNTGRSTVPPNFSIYPGSTKDTFIYERSETSKSDIYSNSEFDDSITTLSSFLSPAQSTDSTLTLRSPVFSETPLEPIDHMATSSSTSQHTFPTQIPPIAPSTFAPSTLPSRTSAFAMQSNPDQLRTAPVPSSNVYNQPEIPNRRPSPPVGVTNTSTSRDRYPSSSADPIIHTQSASHRDASQDRGASTDLTYSAPSATDADSLPPTVSYPRRESDDRQIFPSDPLTSSPEMNPGPPPGIYPPPAAQSTDPRYAYASSVQRETGEPQELFRTSRLRKDSIALVQSSRAESGQPSRAEQQPPSVSYSVTRQNSDERQVPRPAPSSYRPPPMARTMSSAPPDSAYAPPSAPSWHEETAVPPGPPPIPFDRRPSFPGQSSDSRRRDASIGSAEQAYQQRRESDARAPFPVAGTQGSEYQYAAAPAPPVPTRRVSDDRQRASVAVPAGVSFGGQTIAEAGPPTDFYARDEVPFSGARPVTQGYPRTRKESVSQAQVSMGASWPAASTSNYPTQSVPSYNPPVRQSMDRQDVRAALAASEANSAARFANYAPTPSYAGTLAGADVGRAGPSQQASSSQAAFVNGSDTRDAPRTASANLYNPPPPPQRQDRSRAPTAPPPNTNTSASRSSSISPSSSVTFVSSGDQPATTNQGMPRAGQPPASAASASVAQRSPDRETSRDTAARMQRASTPRLEERFASTSLADPPMPAPAQGFAGTQQRPYARVAHVEPLRRNSDSSVASVPPAPALPAEPQRRHSDGEQAIGPPRVPAPGPLAALNPAGRCVRWHENLICPSPIFPDQRRKGWFNRRGDQLWTNEGAYKPPPPGCEFPVDLDGYPDYGEGWMNEECVRIDMQHRLIPKTPLRSALKRTRMREQFTEADTNNDYTTAADS